MSKGLTFVVLLLIAGLLAPAQYAQVNLYVTLANIAAVLLTLALPNAVIRFSISDHSVAAIVSTALLIQGVTLSLGLLLLALGANHLANWLGVPNYLPWFSLIGGALIGVRLCWLASLRAQSRAAMYAGTQALEPIAFVAFAGVVLLTTSPSPPHLIILALVGATAVVAVTAIAMWMHEGGWRPDTGLVRPLILFSGPLVFHGIASAVLGTYDQVLINQLIGSDAAGTYAYAYRFGMSMAIVVTAFSAVWLPYFLRALEERRTDLASAAQQSINWLIAVSVMLMLILPPIARMLGGKAYDSSTGLIPWIVYGYVWFACYTIAVGYALHHKRTGRIAAATLACAALSIGLNLVLLPRLGVPAAALVTVVTYVALFGLQAWVAHSLTPSTVRFRRLAVKVTTLGVVPLALSIAGG